jgi:hypothetical protein
MLGDLSRAAGVLGLVVLGGCASGPADRSIPPDVVVAKIEVVDRPNYKGNLYRYVSWGGENYGPTAFQGAAKGRIKVLALVNATEPGIRCVAALAGALSARAVLIDPAGNESHEIVPSAESVTSACEIPYELPRPELGTGQYYVAAQDRSVAIEGEAFGPPDDLVSRLRSMGATAIVLRKTTIAQLFCFGAVASAAGVKLLEVDRDGSLSELAVGGPSLREACAV